MGKSFEELWAEMTGKQQNAFHMKVWAALGGRETGEIGMKRLMSGQARLVLEDVVKSEWLRLLEACHQDSYCNPDFTESRFSLESVAADEADWEVVEHYLTKTGILEEGVKQLEKLAAKGEIRLLTGSRRAMEYIAQHQAAQLNHQIILPLRVRDSRLHVFAGLQ